MNPNVSTDNQTINQPGTHNTSATENVSQVSPEKNNGLQRKLTHGVALITIAIIVLMMFSGGHSSKQKPTNLINDAPAFKTHLAENMDKLQHQKTPSAPSPPPATKPEVPSTFKAMLSEPLIQPKISRDYLARQNAPTAMYSASSSSVTTLNTGNPSAATNNTSPATFAGSDNYSNFGNQTTKTTNISASAMPHPDYTIASGEFMHANLETAVNSDLPGMVRAVLVGPVYAYVGERPLIPRGSRLIGQYSSQVYQGMTRVFVVWNRIILPSGTSVQINSPGTDQLGRSGMSADLINHHFFSRFGQAALLSIIGAGAATYDVGSQDQYNSQAMYRAAVAQSFQQSAQTSIQNDNKTKPTLSINQGAQVTVFVAHDLDFYSVLMRNKG